MKINDQEQLDELMSRPSGADVAAMQELDGDVLVLGVDDSFVREHLDDWLR